MNALAERYADRDVGSVFLYTHEAHPGEHYQHLTSMDQKFEHAQALSEVYGVTRPIVLDALDGACHRAYGTMPNMIYIVDKGGTIVYKAMWTDHGEIAGVLDNLLLADELRAQGRRVKPSFTEKINFIPAEYGSDIREKVFERAGPQAWADYTRVFKPAS